MGAKIDSLLEERDKKTRQGNQLLALPPLGCTQLSMQGFAGLGKLPWITEDDLLSGSPFEAHRTSAWFL